MNTTRTDNATYLDSDYKDTVILLEDLEFAMSKNQLKEITEMNNEGWNVYEISKEVKRNVYEVIVAILHQAKKGRLLGKIWGAK